VTLHMCCRDRIVGKRRKISYRDIVSQMIAILQYRRRWFPGIMPLLDGCGTAGVHRLKQTCYSFSVWPAAVNSRSTDKREAQWHCK